MNFNEIYDLAKHSRSTATLKKKFKNVEDIDAKKVGNPFFTVAGQLAFEGGVDGKMDVTVEVLRELKAHVDDIALGYARAGNVQKVDEYRTKHGASEKSIIIGYVLGGKGAEAEKYCTNDNPNHKQNIDYLAFAYALVGNNKRVEYYRKSHGADINWIAKGYALSENKNYVKKYFKTHHASKNWIAEGFALKGNLDEAERWKNNITSIFLGCAEAGNHQALDKYRNDHPEYIDSIAFAYACKGNHKKVEEYSTQYKASSKRIAEGYQDHYPEKVKEYSLSALLQNYIDHRTEQRDSQGTKKYLHKNLPKFFQQSYQQKKLVVERLIHALNKTSAGVEFFPEELATLRNGSLGKKLRAFIKAGKANELVGPVNSVTDFVKALQWKSKRKYMDFHFISVPRAYNVKQAKKMYKDIDIDIKNPRDPFLTPAGHFAFKGDRDFVETFRQFGASVDGIAYGYALAGEEDKVEEYVTKYGASVKNVLIGRGRTRFSPDPQNDYGVKYLDPSDSNYSKQNINYLLFGHALGDSGEHDEERHFSTIQKLLNDPNADIDWVVKGYAMANNIPQVEKYCRHLKASSSAAAEGFAMGGDLVKAEEYAKGDMSLIFLGCAFAENHKALDKYRHDNPEYTNQIAYAYACQGKHEQVEKYRTLYRASSKIIAEGYKAAEIYPEKIKEYDLGALLQSYLDPKTAQHDKPGKTKAYLHGHLPGFFQKNLTPEKDAVKALISALNGDAEAASGLTKHLATLQNGNLGKDLRAFIKAGKANELVGQVSSVTDFVKALEKQCKVKAKAKGEVPPL
jgi:hypothetical protein